MKKKILVVDDEESIRWVLGTCLEKAGYSVEYGENGSEALEKTNSEKFSLIILDIKMPDLGGLEVLDELRTNGVDIPVIIITAQNTVKNAIEAMKRGAYDYIAKPFDLDEVKLTAQRAIESYENSKKLELLNAKLKEAVEQEPYGGMIGRSTAMLKVYKTIGRVAEKDLTILITGESGTGKELVARRIHFDSRRREEKFVAVNIAALPKELLESELFGYDKGAFTGAAIRKQGRFEDAHRGTLLLDEIGEMPIELQAKLLRVLEEKQFYRLGGEKPIEVDARVIASTNKDLQKEVEKGTFRKDLYYRINTITIELPSLRERKEDIPLLVEHFVQKYAEQLGVGKRMVIISDQANQILLEYNWPGNVRELENTIKRVLVLSSDTMITSDALLDAAPYLNAINKKENAFDDLVLAEILNLLSLNQESPNGIFNLLIKRVEKPIIEAILKITKGNKKKAAAILGINRNTLSKKIEELGIYGEDLD
jgi:two-component system, NtrC family, nitrogen regulation response regulator GlnG